MPVLNSIIRHILPSTQSECRVFTSAEEIRDEEQAVEEAFLASVAQLPTAQREEAIRRHEWYKRLAHNQEIADIEWRMEQYQQTGERRFLRE